MTDMSYLYTVGGYAVLFGVGYAVYQMSTAKDKKKAGHAPAKATKSAQPEPHKEDKKKKQQRKESFASEAPKKAASKAADPAPWLSNAQGNDTSDDGVDNREFARQLAKAKEGAQFNTKSEGGKQREKSVKQSRANKMQIAAEEKAAALSSSAEADADDDQSPVASPNVTAADEPAQAGDVADMLEAAPAGPSILRLTDTATKEKKQKPAKEAQKPETKKQRQNRKKAEAAKAAREETETERKVLEEKQRRQARIAEGRAAKDGSQFMAANGNNSAWTKEPTNGNDAQTSNGVHQPLDTYVEAPPKAVAPVVAPAAIPKPKSDKEWVSALPSEEEQIEMLKEEDEWSTVKTKSSKRATKKESPVDSGDEPSRNRPAAQPQQAAAGAPKASKSTQSFGSFSALTTDGPADDQEEEEEEWDV